MGGGLLPLAARELDARLERHASAPLIVAFSGGGDSLALLLATRSWAGGVGRRLIAMTVDHQLRPEGADWARWCQERSARLGIAHRSLTWDGLKPGSGLSAAARHARHGLLANAARHAGARVVLMGHTLDDCLEARAMRAAGSTVGEPRVWAPSPVWPAGAGIFILRPLLAARRAELRVLLAELGETWIEDPANRDPGSARARARAESGGDPLLPPKGARPEVGMGPRAGRAFLLTHAVIDATGAIVVPRAALAVTPALETRAFVAAALLCAAGTTRPPRGRSLDALMIRLADDAPFAATLAGARIRAEGARIHIRRELGRNRRGPILASDGTDLRGLVASRLAAACGAIQCEAAIRRVAEVARTP